MVARPETHHRDALDGLILTEQGADLLERDPGGSSYGEAIRASADRWERNAADSMGDHKRKAAPIASREQLVLAIGAAVPDRTHGVNHKARG